MHSDQKLIERNELRTLTGYSRPSKQREWLTRNGIWFGTDRDGYPSTTWHHINNPISLRRADAAAPGAMEPNFDAM